MRYDYFVPVKYQEFVQQCLRVIKNRETVSIIFPPKTDRVWRVNQLIQDYKLGFPIAKIDLPPEETEGMDDVEFQLKRQLGTLMKKDIGIFITNAEAFIQNKNYSLLDSIIQLQEKSTNLRFLFCFETDITHPEIAKRFYQTSIYSNIIYYSLYNAKDTLSFIDYLEGKWRFDLKDSCKERITKECGGHFWFVKYAVRALRDNPGMLLDEVCESEQMNFRLEQIVSTFLESERNVLNKLLMGKTISNSLEKHSQQFLTKMGFIKDDEIAVHVLAKYLRENLPKVAIEMNENKIELNEVNVESHFSRKEKHAFRALFQQKNYIVSRDQIAKALWPTDTEDSYTDWAVDRIIARLRAKLTKLGMPKELIKTFRGRGYMLVS